MPPCASLILRITIILKNKVYSGYLETSNIQVVEEMVNMITIQRAYESNQKLIQTYDSSLEVAVNQVGKL